MEYKIEMLNITKKFGSILANDNITLQVKPGEIHALLGENGAGKSTLMSILFGLYQPDEGMIKIDGKQVNIKNPNDATDLKIGMVHQHFKLVNTFSITESIILGNEPNKAGFLNLKECEKKIKDLSLKYQLEVDPKAKIKDLSVGMQQRVEILKMLYRDADILIFDEPTAVLTPQEIQQLMNIIKNFAKQGKTIIIITHKLNEIKQVADRCTILRKGQSIKTIDVKDTSIQELAKLMVGRDVHLGLFKKRKTYNKPLLEVSHLKVFSKELNKYVVKDLSFNVNEGEILAIAGVEGNGQSELVKAIWGLLPYEKSPTIFNLYIKYIKDTFNFKSKEKLKTRYEKSKAEWLKAKENKTIIKFKGIDISKYSIKKKIALGLGHVPEDRHKHGLVLDYSLKDNMVLNSFYKQPYSNHNILKEKEIAKHCDKLIDEYDIRSSDKGKSITRGMSGGNQQKAVLARELDLNPDLLIAVQPSRGLDIGAIENVHNALYQHQLNNKSILLISYELDEIMNLADRILVMFNGQIVANIQADKTTREELGQYMLGAKKDE